MYQAYILGNEATQNEAIEVGLLENNIHRSTSLFRYPLREPSPCGAGIRIGTAGRRPDNHRQIQRRNRRHGHGRDFGARRLQREDAQLLWIMSLVSENLLTRESANEGLIRFAFTDYLTGLKTRGYFEQQLDLEIKRSERRRQKFALLMIDIDHFKRLNDTFGHHVGDQMLRDVTSILVKDMREVDTVARYGGEEFVMILPETTESGAVYVAHRLRRAVEQAKFFAGSPHEIQHLTISIGVAVYDTDAQFKRDLIEFADAALYAAKHNGRNRVVSYSEINKREQKEVS